MKKKERVIYILAIAAAALYLLIGHQVAGLGSVEYLEGTRAEYVKARVVSIDETRAQEVEVSGNQELSSEEIYLSAEVMKGEKKGKTLEALQTYDGSLIGSIKKVEPGDKVILMSAFEPEAPAQWIVIEYVRSDALWVFAAILGLCILLFGRKKGFNTILSLVFTCAAVFVVFIPAILSGHNIYVWALVTCGAIISLTLLIVSGPNRKSLATALGCTGGLIVSGVLTVVMDSIVHLTGLVDEESMYLMYLNESDPINLRAIIFAAILIGALGAIMDVAMDISAALFELAEHTKTESFSMLVRSGMSIGRDILGTMANTLVLAYIGSSLSLVLLLVAYNDSLLFLFNREMIIVEILQTLVGSFGILFTIPFTSLICGKLYTRRLEDAS